MSVEREIHFDHDAGTVTTRAVQDVEDIIERNKRLQNEEQRSDWGRHIASIPNIFMEKWLNEEWSRGNMIMNIYGPEMEEIVWKKLRDPEYRWLRVTDKRF